VGEPGPAALVIGIGNPDRGDDGAGPAVARRLREMLPPEVHVIEHDGEPSSLLAHLSDATKAFLIDAASSLEPGEIRRFDVSASPLPVAPFRLSTHGLGLPEAVELARALGQLPGRCIVYAIGAVSFEPGLPLSPAVIDAVRITVEGVLAEIADCL
jgi:hydrogenase maturation protease